MQYRVDLNIFLRRSRVLSSLPVALENLMVWTSALAGRVRVGGCWRLGIAAPAGAQIGAGALAGDVVDQAGAAVPGATVTVDRGRHQPVAARW